MSVQTCRTWSFAVVLFAAFSEGSHKSEKRAKERLTDLYHEDRTPDGGPYLDRPIQQLRTVDSKYNQLVYDLAPAGRKALRLPSSGAPNAGPWTHRFMTACVTASIELATLKSPNVSFIPCTDILKRANATLACNTEIVSPNTKETATVPLVPDGLFGLAYKQRGKKLFRFFAVEADRGTEPVTSSNFSRKSYLRNVLQYQAYVEGRLYKEHLNLQAPMLVLYVFSEQAKLQRMKALLAKQFGSAGCPYICLAHIDGFEGAFKPLPPQFHLLRKSWQRAGCKPFNISAA